LDWDYLGNFRNALTNVSFDAHLEGHGAAGAAVAGTVESHLHHTGGADIDQFDIAAVSLDGGAD
jgi:hypothetical protein